MPIRHTPVEVRMWARVTKKGPDDVGATATSVGVGPALGERVNGVKKEHSVARLILGLQEGDGLVARHTCDNPNCCNPRHLLAGTQQDNLADMRERGRDNPRGWKTTGWH